MLFDFEHQISHKAFGESDRSKTEPAINSSAIILQEMEMEILINKKWKIESKDLWKCWKYSDISYKVGRYLTLSSKIEWCRPFSPFLGGGGLSNLFIPGGVRETLTKIPLKSEK